MRDPIDHPKTEKEEHFRKQQRAHLAVAMRRVGKIALDTRMWRVGHMVVSVWFPDNLESIIEKYRKLFGLVLARWKLNSLYHLESAYVLLMNERDQIYSSYSRFIS